MKNLLKDDKVFKDYYDLDGISFRTIRKSVNIDNNNSQEGRGCVFVVRKIVDYFCINHQYEGECIRS